MTIAHAEPDLLSKNEVELPLAQHLDSEETREVFLPDSRRLSRCLVLGASHLGRFYTVMWRAEDLCPVKSSTATQNPPSFLSGGRW